MLEIDGSTLEGGGQILRTALSLSVITQEPCRIFNIRYNRPNQGLAHQHLLAIQALVKFCDARIEGDFLGSKEIKFYPSQNYKNSISVNIPTAGSITLVLQALLPAVLFVLSKNSKDKLKSANLVRKSMLSNGVKIVFNGGATDTFFSPTIDYFKNVFLGVLEKMGAIIKIDVVNRGYYPEGGAKAEVNISPAPLKGINLIERGNFKNILAISGASMSLKEKKVAERQLAGAREILGKLKLPISERVEYYLTKSPGSQICLVAVFENTIIGADNLGKLGKRAEEVGKEAALELLKEEKSGACLDKHLADQILPYLTLAGKKSQVMVSEITPHCKTNIWVIEKFIDGKFEIEYNLIKWLPR